MPLVPAERLEGELRPYLDHDGGAGREILRTYSPVETLDTGKEKERLKARVKELQDERDELVKSLPAFDKAYAASEGTPADARIQIKGDPTKLGPEVPRGFLQVLGGAAAAARRGGQRPAASWRAG